MVVVPSDSQQAALAALVEFDPGEDGARRTPSGSATALAAMRAGAVAPAARDDAEGRFGAATRSASPTTRSSPGAAPGRRWRRPSTALADGAEIVTVIEGAEAPIALEELGLTLPDGAELELHHGGTPNYSWLIAAQ